MMRVRINVRNVKFLIISIIVIVILFVLLSLAHDGSQVRFYIVEYKGPRSRDYEVHDDPDTEEYLDTFKPFFINRKNVTNVVKGKTCTEKHNLVFIKTMKCATQTLVQILRRFGYVRNLNFVLPRRDHIYLRWPLLLERLDYRPSSRPFNMLVDHAIYNKTIMTSLMPADTKYITILREPYSYFKSAFNYFNVANITGVKGEDKVTEYLHNIHRFEDFYMSPEGSKIRYCIPNGFSVTKNLLAHCLGMPLGFPKDRENIKTNEHAVSEYIREVDSEFSLVMIMEHFHESLVLLRRLMCWSMRDIVYMASNIGNYSFKSTKPRDDNLNIYKKWSHIDYLLYDHFNKTLWKKIAAEGEGFAEEVEEFISIEVEVWHFCSSLDGRQRNLVITASQYTEAFTVSPDYCLLMGVDLLDYLKRRYDREENWVEPEEEKDEGQKKRAC